MKIVTSVAGLLLAGTLSIPATAGPSRGEIMTLCKSEIKDTFEEVSRIRTSRFRDKASGTYITFKVSAADAETQKVTCTYRDGVANLAGDNGALVATNDEVVQSGS
jgi:hypothetical protein